MSFTTSSPLDAYRSRVESELDAGKNYTQIAVELSARGVLCSRHSIRRAVKRWRNQSDNNFSISVDENDAEFTANISSPSYSLETLCKERGLDPEEWTVALLTVNKWDSPTGLPLEQVKASLKRRKLDKFITQAQEIEKREIPKVKKFKAGDLVVCLSDQHAPHHDKQLHALVCGWLAHNQPQHGLILGDLLDFPEISRYRHDPAWSASTQVCINEGYQILKDYVTASPETNWRFYQGNHSFRLQKYILERAKEIYDIKPAGLDQFPALGLTHLLRLNDLGIHYEEREDGYEYAKVKLNANLGAIHGHQTRKGTGATALLMIEKYNHSIIHAHTHRLGVVSKTVYDLDDEPRVLMGAENGCLCCIKGGLGHSINPNWQQGFVTTSLHPDDRFHLDVAAYDQKKLIWRGEQYS